MSQVFRVPSGGGSESAGRRRGGRARRRADDDSEIESGTTFVTGFVCSACKERDPTSSRIFTGPRAIQSAHGHIGGSRTCRQAGAQLLEVNIPFGSRDTMVGGSGAAAAPRRRENQEEADAAIVRRLRAMHGALTKIVAWTNNEVQCISHEIFAKPAYNAIWICDVSHLVNYCKYEVYAKMIRNFEMMGFREKNHKSHVAKPNFA